MVVVQATKLSLPNPSLSSPQITSFLFEPHSLSLALMHSDSSFSLYPSFSPFFLSSLPSPQLVVPSPSSSAAFVVLRNSDSNSDSKVLFVVSGPHQGGSRILLRFYVLETCNLFRRVRVVCTQKDLRSDDKLGVLVNLRHGLSVRLAGSVNFFAMYSISSSKIWVFAVKMVAGGDGRDDVMDLKLMRCAVIDCCKPIWSISISFGYLLLGEDNGVRVLNLRPFVRGRGRKVRNLNAKREVQKSFLPHGEVYGTSGGTDEHASKSDDAQSSAICNGSLDGKLDKHFDSVRARSVKLRQDSSEGGLYFVALKGRGIDDQRSAKMMPLKALSIQALSPRKILILDSVGDLHLLHLASSANGSDFSYNIRPLPHLMKVQTLTSVPDTSISRCQRTSIISYGAVIYPMLFRANNEFGLSLNRHRGFKEMIEKFSLYPPFPRKKGFRGRLRSVLFYGACEGKRIIESFEGLRGNQTVWLSDKQHSVHMMMIPDVDSDVPENRGNESEEVPMKKISDMQVIFAGEKIQDITSLSTNAVLILGQGSLYAYTIS